jgi:DNA repair protein RadC
MTYQIISERKIRNPGKIKTPEDVYSIVKRYTEAKQEHFIVVTLNAVHEPISVCITGIGTVSKTIVHPREVFIKAILDRATAIIICHNHPSGSIMPSSEDIEITTRLFEAGKIMGIRVIDHLIISKTGYCSMLREGVFPTLITEEKGHIPCDDCNDHTLCAENTKPCPFPDYPIGNINCEP